MGDILIDSIHLTIANLERSLKFYKEALGFRVHHQDGSRAALGAGEKDLLVLTEDKRAQRSLGTTGLYHFAVLVHSRAQLAHSLQRLIDLRIALGGFADHLVSEAIYLADPDGNGIEIYRDRPREKWLSEDGQLQMATDPLDVQGLLAEVEGKHDTWSGLSSKTIIGHIHLHVAQIPESETFYQEVIGFDLMQRYGKNASFLSAQGYHHHVGINTWVGVDAPPPPADSIGLRYFVLKLGDETEHNQLRERMDRSKYPYEETQSGLRIDDPSSNTIVTEVRAA